MALDNFSDRLVIGTDGIDDYGHLNNAAYPGYFEGERKRFAVCQGLDRFSLARRGLAFLVKEAKYQYHAPVFCDQEVEIETTFAGIKRARVFVQQKMYHKREIVASCNVEYFFLDLQSKKPIKIPEDIFLHLNSEK